MKLFGNPGFSTRAMGKLCCHDPHLRQVKSEGHAGNVLGCLGSVLGGTIGSLNRVNRVKSLLAICCTAVLKPQ